MRKVGNMTLYTFEEILDRHQGPIGTPKRDAFEAKVQAEIEKERRKLEAKRQKAEKQAPKADETTRKARRAQPVAVLPTPAV